ncbi:MAG TPA: class I SAM-dependent methyltransferase [Mycobacteriales bacterium]|nr:class I SAM-dependent methyltransferase [Mycobacteriales bacterium]
MTASTWQLPDVLQRRLEVPVLCALLPVPRGGRVLELGCGSGNTFPALHKALQPSLLVGIDLPAWAQLLAHPRQLRPWVTGAGCPELVPVASAVLWAMHRRN